uniref:peptidylprolyl isomerase n=1 Tax=Chromera velia CCMP2878 TaxID=1169474 RepID=A0A0G4FUF7_9ALVE|mmetsp:Transcript_8526/g.16670  ORF Transcript_8526/g.16670 Transcript_8526/m.16670 type:complete len:268 (-) Transcript_8526:301-1104(-)|eukprot:Cvel_18741.t1-p1 / transcript=Cvel_18741.t1 / gene=Cvel_18741 / organism=Chromera_velia_CCMP2878 / gene_product=Peptidyl-prolyl cis-trans isomerase FKBP16-1,, putative / transcript_product=Peptidyl-prolyl cis-trans isomerase FKBP16-1,, putative / location=Cvel_scaffold1571:39015-41789(+) / protein_length=267 / sequence_SO=supercontig / SO=protein_coding / is_pseudo=false
MLITNLFCCFASLLSDSPTALSSFSNVRQCPSECRRKAPQGVLPLRSHSREEDSETADETAPLSRRRQVTSSVSSLSLLASAVAAAPLLLLKPGDALALSKLKATNIEEARRIGEAKIEEEERQKGPIRRINGIKVREPKVGTGAECESGDLCKIRYQVYKGNGDYMFSLGYGREFKEDQTELYAFKYQDDDDQKIPLGVERAMQGMRVGGQRKILIPPDQGFETSSDRPEPDTYSGKRKLEAHRKEALVMEVELVKVFKPKSRVSG